MGDSANLRLRDHFPLSQYPSGPLPNQLAAFDIIQDHDARVTLELPTGSGKTAIGYTVLKALESLGQGPLFYIVPNKTLVDQVQRLHPELKVAYGRNEHDCLYYDHQPRFRADAIPCSMLKDCIHRVNQTTGAVHTLGADPCPYLLQKWQAKQGGIVVCTASFYLFTQLFSQEWPTPAGLVIDEAHRLADVVRQALSCDITDWHLRKSVELLQEIGAPEAEALQAFLKVMIYTIKRKPAHTQSVLDADEIKQLLDALGEVDGQALGERIQAAVASGQIDPVVQRETLTRLETLVGRLYRYLRSLEFALPSAQRHSLNYTFAYWEEEKGEREHAQYRLYIKAYYVVPLVRKILAPRTVAMSATIGNAEVFQFETGIDAPFHALTSDFPAQNTRVFVPTDTPNLASQQQSRRDLPRSLRQIAKTCKRFARKGLRSLVVVVSNDELQRFLRMAREEDLHAISYGNGVTPREAARVFSAGEGVTLAGTAANYREGLDLPERLAPVIFFLRPGYPHPNAPQTVFEKRRFGQSCWKTWNWRVMIEALQVRGRNIRGPSDKGVTFFISQQFRRFVYGSLPAWLQGAYRGEHTFEQCVREAEKLLA